MKSISSTIEFLKHSLTVAASSESMEWLELQVAKIKADKGSMKLFLSFSQASRHFSKYPMDLPIDIVPKAEAIRNGFTLKNWTELQTARVVLVLEAFSDDYEKWFEDLEKLFESADIHEQEALYAALPIYPSQEKFIKRAAEGLRSNMTSVFDAIALNNPYPADYLSEQAWNQMVLKAIFMQRPLYKIVGVEQRHNVNLATTLVDYIHERWSAGRNVIPELWRFLSPFIDEEIVALLKKVWEKGGELEKHAAALACHESDNLAAKRLLAAHPEIKGRIDNGEINWSKIGEDFEDLN